MRRRHFADMLLGGRCSLSTGSNGVGSCRGRRCVFGRFAFLFHVLGVRGVLWRRWRFHDALDANGASQPVKLTGNQDIFPNELSGFLLVV
jgi:hypothetical protein